MRSLRNLLFVFLLTAFIAMALGCGGGNGSSGNPMQPGTSAVTISIGDSPLDWIVAFQIQVDSIVLHSNQGANITVLSTPTRVELTHLAGVTTPINVAQVPQGTYTRATITLSEPQITVINPATQQPEVKTPPIPTRTVTLFFNPAFVVSGDAANLNFDLDVGRSVVVGGDGSMTVNPFLTMMHVRVPRIPMPPVSARLMHMPGRVTNVFAGGFTVSTLLGQRLFTFKTDASTLYYPVGLTLAQGMVVVVDAVPQPDGGLLALRVRALQSRPSVIHTHGFIAGTSGIPVTQLKMVVHGAMGGISFGPSVLGIGILVNVNENTTFEVFSDAVDMSGLPFSFSRDSVSVGQVVGTNSDITPTFTTPDTMGGGMMPLLGNLTARQVMLQPQALGGVVSDYNADDKTFTLTLPADSAFAVLTKQTTVKVYFRPSAASEATLPAIKNGDKVRVRGLLFKEAGGFNMVAGLVLLPPTTTP